MTLAELIAILNSIAMDVSDPDETEVAIVVGMHNRTGDIEEVYVDPLGTSVWIETDLSSE